MEATLCIYRYARRNRCDSAQVKLTDDTPIRCKPYSLLYAMREELQNEVDSMLEMGVVRPSASPYASPIVMVKKKDGPNRVCVDFRKLNQTTDVDPEPMQMAENLFLQLSGKKYLSKINLTNDTGRYGLFQRICQNSVCDPRWMPSD